MPRSAFAGPSGDHRPRVLPREIGRGSGRDRRDPRSNRQDAYVLRKKETVGTAEELWGGSRLAMNTNTEKTPERDEIEALLPWHAAGTLSRRGADKMEQAIARDPELA